MNTQRIRIFAIDDIIEEFLFEFTNGDNSTKIEVYCEIEWLRDFGHSLNAFPKSIDDSIDFELRGSNTSLLLHIYCYKWTGQAAIRVEVEDKLSAPDDYLCRFSIKTVPASLNNLGEMLLNWDLSLSRSIEWIAED